ncbi:MAG: GNAT family N-acetyltransferase [Defluviitaleaceae bacterium]|nr:GNAT family N-acetyltransferase [Defluviitaleaceae bacterium]
MLNMYRESDLPACVKIYVEAFNAPPLSYSFLTEDKAERYLRDLTHSPGFMGYTYRVNGEIAAFCFGRIDDYFEGVMYELSEFAVTPALQRSGIGTEIMRLLETKAAGYGVQAINLNTSRKLPAFNFYKKNGYEEISENVSLMKLL